MKAIWVPSPGFGSLLVFFFNGRLFLGLVGTLRSELWVGVIWSREVSTSIGSKMGRTMEVELEGKEFLGLNWEKSITEDRDALGFNVPIGGPEEWITELLFSISSTTGVVLLGMAEIGWVKWSFIEQRFNKSKGLRWLLVWTVSETEVAWSVSTLVGWGETWV